MFQQLSGRLGNQLFQWAYAHYLNDKFGKRVELFVDKYHARENYLEDLLSRCEHCENGKVKNSLGNLLRFLDKINLRRNMNLDQYLKYLKILRLSNSYDMHVNSDKTPFLITGFFIGNEIVNNYEQLLFEELMITVNNVKKVDLPTSNYQLFHVRLGDYLTTNKTYGNLSVEYYLKNRDQNLPLVITTDSVDGLDYLIDILKPVQIFSPLNSDSWQALKLMACSTNFVMANSTLSWWGGFLVNKNGGKVICPKPFYKNLSEETDLSFHRQGFQYSPAIYFNPE